MHAISSCSTDSHHGLQMYAAGINPSPLSAFERMQRLDLQREQTVAARIRLVNDTNLKGEALQRELNQLLDQVRSGDMHQNKWQRLGGSMQWCWRGRTEHAGFRRGHRASQWMHE